MKPRSSVVVVIALVLLLGSAGTGSAAVRSAAPTGGSGPSWSRRGDARGNPKLTSDAVGHSAATSGPLANVRPIDKSGTDAQGRRDVVVEGADPAKLAATVRAHGGEVLTTAPGAVRAQVPAGQLEALAAESDVTRVRGPNRLQADATSEGVASTGAAAWQSPGGIDGTGVKVGIVDVGFQNYMSKLGTELPASVTPKNFCGSGTTGFDGSGPSGSLPPTQHGTAVSEIVHDMAPGASLYLVCVFDATDFALAESYLAGQGVTIVNASIGSALDGRGDGGSGAAAAAVKAGREAGQLWTVAAGNLAGSHFDAFLRDADGDTAMEMFPGPVSVNTPDPAEEYIFGLQPLGVSIVQLKWDAWPITNYDYDIIVYQDVIDDAHVADCTVIGGCNDQNGTAQPPVEEAAFQNGDTVNAHTYFVFIHNFNGAPNVRADLYFLGNEYNKKAIDPTQSLADPATSPFVMTAGAACYSASTIEPYSSQGPTIDGRVKPDITGPDGTSSSVYGAASGCGSPTGFTGTSAAAPHVAGAAALLKQANSALDASQIQDLLERKAAALADAGAQGKDNIFGSGLLRLGTSGTAAPPTPVPYHGVTPVRVIDTRPQYLPISHGDLPLGPGQSMALTFAGATFGTTTVPANATAVVLNVTAVNTTASSWFTVWPAGAAKPNASNLNFTAGQVVANSVTATIGSGGQVLFANQYGNADLVVDLVGWYAPGAEAGLVPVNPPVRALDSRTSGGPIGPGGILPVQLRNTTFQGTLIPATATAVALNVTAVQPTASGWFTVWPHGDTQPTASSLNFTPGSIVPNLVIATIGTSDRVDFFNSGGNTNIVIDVLGYFMPAAGDGYVPLPAPTRDLDTRTGNGPKLGSLQGGFPFDLDVGGVYGVPADAPAVLLNVTVNAPNGSGFLTVYPTGSPSSTSNLNFTAGQTVPNAVIASLGTQGRATFSVQPTVPFCPTISDLQGYYYPL